MPNSSQAKKRLRQDEHRRVHNRAISSRMRTEVKKVFAAAEAGDAEAAQAAMPEAVRRIDKCAKRNIIHANNAARKKSQLQRRINELTRPS